MLPSADTKFDYAALPTEKAASARAAAERIRGRMQLAAESIIEVGRELIEQKKQLGHGNFLPWIEAEFGMSGVSASRMMNVAIECGDKSFTVKHLAPTALYALAAPSTPEPVRTEVLERAASGETVTAKQITELKAKLSKAESALEKANTEISLTEFRAKEAAKQRDSAQTARLYAEQDKDRLTGQIEDLVDEISRLKEDGVIHVEQATPTAIHAHPPRVDTILIAMQAMWERAGIETRNSFLDWAKDTQLAAA